MCGAALPILPDLLGSLCRGQAGCGDPAITESGGPLDGLRCRGTDPYVNGLGRQWASASRPQGQRLVCGDLLAREQTSKHCQSRLKPCDASAQRHAHGAELVFATTQGTLQDEPPLSEACEGPHLIGQSHRVPQRQQEERANRPFPPLGQQSAQHRHVLVVGAPRAVMLAQEEGLQPRVSRGPDPLDHPTCAGPRIRGAVTASFGYPDVHVNRSSTVSSSESCSSLPHEPWWR